MEGFLKQIQPLGFFHHKGGCCKISNKRTCQIYLINPRYENVMLSSMHEGVSLLNCNFRMNDDKALESMF